MRVTEEVRPGSEVKGPAIRETISRQTSESSVQAVLPRTASKVAPGYDDDFDLTEEEWTGLTAEERRLYAALFHAFDEDDEKAALRLVKSLQAHAAYPDGVSLPIRKLIAEKIGWFGAEVLPQVMNMLTDPDSDVRQAAAESYAELIEDDDLTERELSSAIIAGAQLIDDPDILSGIFQEINDCNMHNAVAVDTMIGIMESGSKPAKEALQETINDFTDTDEEDGLLDTPEKLREWLATHADEPDDASDEAVSRADDGV